MAKLRIDEGDLLMAFESGDGMTQWFLDRQTGDVIGLDDNVWMDDEDAEDDAEAGDEDAVDEDDDEDDWQVHERALRRKIYADVSGERYLPIPSLSSNEGFRIMERFAASQEGRVRETLFDALDRRRPFRSFKDALEDFPKVREAWFGYHEEQVREEAVAWLESEGIDAELVPYRDASPG